MQDCNTIRTYERDIRLKRALLRSTSFIRAARRMLKKYPLIADDLGSVLELLANDAFHPFLKTHKLKGILKD